jgi:hypothetical protein
MIESLWTVTLAEGERGFLWNSQLRIWPGLRAFVRLWAKRYRLICRSGLRATSGSKITRYLRWVLMAWCLRALRAIRRGSNSTSLRFTSSTHQPWKTDIQPPRKGNHKRGSAAPHFFSLLGDFFVLCIFQLSPKTQNQSKEYK